jgi:hypothetical protein
MPAEGKAVVGEGAAAGTTERRKGRARHRAEEHNHILQVSLSGPFSVRDYTKTYEGHSSIPRTASSLGGSWRSYAPARLIISGLRE